MPPSSQYLFLPFGGNLYSYSNHHKSFFLFFCTKINRIILNEIFCAGLISSFAQHIFEVLSTLLHAQVVFCFLFFFCWLVFHCKYITFIYPFSWGAFTRSKPKPFLGPLNLNLQEWSLEDIFFISFQVIVMYGHVQETLILSIHPGSTEKTTEAQGRKGVP